MAMYDDASQFQPGYDEELIASILCAQCHEDDDEVLEGWWLRATDDLPFSLHSDIGECVELELP
jgi:hypothetical protein